MFHITNAGEKWKVPCQRSRGFYRTFQRCNMQIFYMRGWYKKKTTTCNKLHLLQWWTSSASSIRYVTQASSILHPQKHRRGSSWQLHHILQEGDQVSTSPIILCQVKQNKPTVKGWRANAKPVESTFNNPPDWLAGAFIIPASKCESMTKCAPNSINNVPQISLWLFNQREPLDRRATRHVRVPPNTRPISLRWWWWEVPFSTRFTCTQCGSHFSSLDSACLPTQHWRAARSKHASAFKKSLWKLWGIKCEEAGIRLYLLTSIIW